MDEHGYAGKEQAEPGPSGAKKRKGNTSTYCCVPQCNNYAREGLRFHLFPKDNQMRVVWKVALKMGKRITDSDRVCSDHFLASDYLPQAKPTAVRHLKKIAIPSQKLPVRSLDKPESSPVKKLKLGRKERAESRSSRSTEMQRLYKSRKLMLH